MPIFKVGVEIVLALVGNFLRGDEALIRIHGCSLETPSKEGIVKAVFRSLLFLDSHDVIRFRARPEEKVWVFCHEQN